MSPQPLLPGEGAFPADQIRIPCPPSRFESSTGGVLRRPLGDILYWMPPYCVDEAQLQLLAEATAAAIEEATACA